MEQNARVLDPAGRLVSLVLPFPVSTNRYWRSPGNGRVLVSKVGLRFAARVAEAVSSQLPGHRPISGRLAFTAVLCAPGDGRRRDLDNFGGKSLLDSLTKARLWLDDSQIDDLRIVRGEPIDGEGACTVTVREIAEQEGKTDGR